MLEPEERQELKKGMRASKVIWVFFLASLALYLIICHQINNELVDIGFDDDTLWLIKAILAFSAFMTLVTAYFMKKYTLLIQATNAKTSIFQKMFTSKTRKFVFSQNLALSKYTRVTMTSIAFAESVGIYGLILFYLSGEFITLYAFVIVSAIALLYFRPRFEELEQLAINLKRHHDSSNPSPI